MRVVDLIIELLLVKLGESLEAGGQEEGGEVGEGEEGRHHQQLGGGPHFLMSSISLVTTSRTT